MNKRKQITLLIKPSSGMCNIACRYCFYRDETENRTDRNMGFMSEGTARNLIEKSFCVAEHVTFSFQGGEPTLSGLGFFKFFRDTALKAGNASFSIQTNGMLIDREWAEFFRESGFLVGLSMDGMKSIHDLYRVNGGGVGTFRKVFSASQILKSSGVDTNILVTLTKDAALRGAEIYDFLKRNGFRWQQYIPCIDPISGERGRMDWSLDNGSFSFFLKKVFDLYFRDWSRGDYVSIRFFDNLVLRAAGMIPEECGMLGFCPSNYVSEADGSIYPCDFYVLDSYRLGNINSDSFDDFDSKRKEIRFTELSLEHTERCLNCRFFPLCRGGCRRDREDFATGKIGTTFFCPAYMDFYEYAWERIMYMGSTERASRMGSELGGR